MKLSELQAALSKVQTFAGDVEVVLKAAESEVETVVGDLGLKLTPGGDASGALTIEHAPAAPAAPAESGAAEGDPDPAAEGTPADGQPLGTEQQSEN